MKQALNNLFPGTRSFGWVVCKQDKQEYVYYADDNIGYHIDGIEYCIVTCFKVINEHPDFKNPVNILGKYLVPIREKIA